MVDIGWRNNYFYTQCGTLSYSTMHGRIDWTSIPSTKSESICTEKLGHVMMKVRR